MKSLGFTLIEVLVVVTVVVLLAAASFPIYTSLQSSNSLQAEKDLAIQSLRQAQALAMQSLNDNDHGVYFDTNQYTVYEGTSYVARVQANDILIEVGDSIEITPAAIDINFDQKTGLPNQSITIDLTNTLSSDSLTITINDEGSIF